MDAIPDTSGATRPEATGQDSACPGMPDPTRADLIIRNLGFCGHYLHFHGGGRSGREPILCLLHCMGGQMSQQALCARFGSSPGRSPRSSPKSRHRASLSARAIRMTAANSSSTSRRMASERPCRLLRLGRLFAARRFRTSQTRSRKRCSCS